MGISYTLFTQPRNTFIIAFFNGSFFIAPVFDLCYKIVMKPGDIVFDIETQHSFDEVGGRDRFDKLGISVLGAYIYGDNTYVTYEEHEIPKFEKLLSSAGTLIGFNIHHFDLPVLQPYVSLNLK